MNAWFSRPRDSKQPRGALAQRWGDQSGSVMPFLAVTMFLLIAFLGVALDVGRWLVGREAVITATESASLAGASSSMRMIRFTGKWDYYDWVRECDTVCSANGSCRRVCYWVCQFDQTKSRTFEGLERDLTDENQWQNMVDTGCRDGAKWIEGTPERWVEFDRPEEHARAMFYRNLSSANAIGTRVEAPRVDVYDNPNDPHYPSVKVEAEAWTPAKFLPVLGIQGFGTQRCSQAMVRGYVNEVASACGKRSASW